MDTLQYLVNSYGTIFISYLNKFTMERFSFARESNLIYWTIIEGNVIIRNRIPYGMKYWRRI